MIFAKKAVTSKNKEVFRPTTRSDTAKRRG
jgi:hypothetical protein